MDLHNRIQNDIIDYRFDLFIDFQKAFDLVDRLKCILIYKSSLH